MWDVWARAQPKGKRAHAVIEGRAGAGRITIQLRGERELLLHHTHNNKKFPLMLATRATPVRARPLARAHTHTHTHTSICMSTRVFLLLLFFFFSFL